MPILLLCMRPAAHFGIGTAGQDQACSRSAADAEILDKTLVTAYFRFLEIVEQAPTSADHLDQSMAGAMVFLVGLQMLGELLYLGGKYSNLYVGRTRIAFVPLVFLLNACFVDLTHIPTSSSSQASLCFLPLLRGGGI